MSRESARPPQLLLKFTICSWRPAIFSSIGICRSETVHHIWQCVSKASTWEHSSLTGQFCPLMVMGMENGIEIPMRERGSVCHSLLCKVTIDSEVLGLFTKQTPHTWSFCRHALLSGPAAALLAPWSHNVIVIVESNARVDHISSQYGPANLD